MALFNIFQAENRYILDEIYLADYMYDVINSLISIFDTFSNLNISRSNADACICKQ